MELKCSICRVQACRNEPGTKTLPAFCPALQDLDALTGARQIYHADPESQQLALSAARVEAAGYCRWPRVQEVMEFARGIGATRLGIATCVGLIREAGLLQEILEANGFQVSSVCCKVGSIPKEEIGLADDEKARPGQWDLPSSCGRSLPIPSRQSMLASRRNVVMPSP